MGLKSTYGAISHFLFINFTVLFFFFTIFCDFCSQLLDNADGVESIFGDGENVVTELDI